MQRPSTAYRPPLPRRSHLAGGSGAAPGRCPFVGALADPGTSLAFPSDSNHCFRTSFPIPISSIHQENYCLSAQYAACPVFQQYASEPDKESLIAPMATAAIASPMGPNGGLPGDAIMTGAGVAVGATLSRPAPAVALSVAPLPASLPDFAPYDPSQEAPGAARHSTQIDKRIVLLGLALLALLALAGGARLKLFGGRADSEDARQGAVVALPTLAPTADQSSIASADVSTDAAPTATTPAAAGIVDAATATPTELDSVAATATALFAGVIAPIECSPAAWWAAYVVQEGDTVESLAAARGITPEELIVGNCLGPQPLAAGQSLFLPPVGVIVALPGPATATPVPTLPTTRTAGLPTRRPLLFPTPIVVIIATAHIITPEAPATDPPQPRPSRAPATAVPPPATATWRPTVTVPAPPPTATPPDLIATATPPEMATAAPTRTPPVPTSTVPVFPEP